MILSRIQADSAARFKADRKACSLYPCSDCHFESASAPPTCAASESMRACKAASSSVKPLARAACARSNCAIRVFDHRAGGICGRDRFPQRLLCGDITRHFRIELDKRDPLSVNGQCHGFRRGSGRLGCECRCGCEGGFRLEKRSARGESECDQESQNISE